MKVHQIPVRKDNYIYVLEDPNLDHIVAIDPADATPVIHLSQNLQKPLSAIYITHHHEDHSGGAKELQRHFACHVHSYSEDSFRIPATTTTFKNGDSWFYGSHEFKVIFTPGHTTGHVVFYGKDAKLLLCGDTLFAYGCGRLFEGTPAMMLESLRKVRALPGDTTVYCSHEYTQTNLEFAMNLEPQNQALFEKYNEVREKRSQNISTVPFLLSEQIQQNPLLRWDDKILHTALGMTGLSDLDIFTEIRSRRNRW